MTAATLYMGGEPRKFKRSERDGERKRIKIRFDADRRVLIAAADAELSLTYARRAREKSTMTDSNSTKSIVGHIGLSRLL